MAHLKTVFGVKPHENVAYQFLDLTAKGRDEDGSQEHSSGWVRHRDRYED